MSSDLSELFREVLKEGMWPSLWREPQESDPIPGRKYKLLTCHDCHGQKEVTRDSQTLTCPKCQGWGKLSLSPEGELLMLHNLL